MYGVKDGLLILENTFHVFEDKVSRIILVPKRDVTCGSQGDYVPRTP
jgi:hypothetical protein